MSRKAATSKPVLPPISASPSPQSTSTTVGDGLTEALKEARDIMAKLRQASEDFVSNSTIINDIVENLRQLLSNYPDHWVPLFRVFQDEALCNIWIQMWSALDLKGVEDVQTLDNKTGTAVESWTNLLLIILSITDSGESDLINRLVTCNLIKFSVDILGGSLLSAQRVSKPLRLVPLYLLGILYNVMKKWDGGIKAVRTLEGPERAVAKFAASNDLAIKTMAIIVLTFLLKEEEQKKMLDSTKTNIKYMLLILDDCLKSTSKGHVGQYGYSAVEIIDGITRMAATEANKEKIVDSGALPLFAKVLTAGGSFSSEEHEEACKCLWTLSFSQTSKVKIAADAGCMEGLRRSAASSHQALRKAAEGALWVIEGEAKHVQSLAAKKNLKENDSKADAGGHIMLSYNWGCQTQAIRIKEALSAAGYRVWIDVENMSGSTLEAMSKAVEDAWLVLIFFTEKYKLSSPCRLEAEYTYSRGKKFIPIKMEAGYKPDGWLGMLMATKLFVDFTKEGQWDVAFQKLCAEIGKMKSEDSVDLMHAHVAITTSSESPGNQKDVPNHKQSSRANQNSADYLTLSANSWGKEDIRQWLLQNSLEQYTQRFEGFSGRHLISLRRLMDGAPEFFYQSLKEEFCFRFLDMLTFADMLQTLT